MATSRLKTKYNDEIIPSLMETLKFKSIMQVPKIKKISVNQGLGAAVNDKKLIQFSVDELTQITGQKAVATKAKKSIAGFKVREEMPLGVKVTLRRDKMYEFLDRLITIAMPRIRDFRGVSPKSFDGRGNYALGIKEHIVFPEIDFDKVDSIWGLDIVLCTSANSDDEARELLREFNMPFYN